MKKQKSIIIKSKINPENLKEIIKVVDALIHIEKSKN
jgi:hypothetical protein